MKRDTKYPISNSRKPGMTLLLLAILLLTGNMLLAQPCVQSELTNKPGIWKQGTQGSIHNVSAENLAREKEIVAKAFEIIKEGYSPLGCEVTYTGRYGYNLANGKNWVADPYTFAAYFLRYLCDSKNPGKHYVDVSTPTTLEINFNLMAGMYNGKYAADLPDDDEQGFVAVKKLPEYMNGYYFLKSDVEYNNKIKEYKWYFFYDNKLPYKQVTKKEYLQYLQNKINKNIAEVNSSEAKMKAKPYYTEDDKRLFAGQRDYYEKPLREVENMLKNMSEKELSEPAIIKSSGGDSPIDNFVPEGTEYSNILVKPNLAYYNTKLPRSAPQVISITLTVSHGDPVFEHIYEHITKAININKFKAMLTDQSQVSYPVQSVSYHQQQASKPAAVPTSTPATHITTATAVPSPAASTSASAAPSNPSAQPITQTNVSDPTQIPVYDLDSNKYDVIKIGSQYWLKQNLRTTWYRDTTRIATGLSDEQWRTTSQGAYTVYQNNDKHEKTYGKLYNGYAVSTNKLCPEGWHVPTDDEWKILEDYLGIPRDELDRTGGRGSSGGKIKATELWKPATVSSDNSTGFSALPAGSRKEYGDYDNIEHFTGYWTGTTYETSNTHMWYRHLYYHTDQIGRLYTKKNNGFSVRCIKN